MNTNSNLDMSHGIRCANGHIIIPWNEVVDNLSITKQDFHCTQCDWTRTPLNGVYVIDQLPGIIRWLKIYAGISALWILINIIFGLGWGWWIIPLLTLTGSLMRYRGGFFKSDFNTGKFNINLDTNHQQSMQSQISYCLISDGIKVGDFDVLDPSNISGDFQLIVFTVDSKSLIFNFTDVIKYDYREDIMPFIHQLHNAGYLVY